MAPQANPREALKPHYNAKWLRWLQRGVKLVILDFTLPLCNCIIFKNGSIGSIGSAYICRGSYLVVANRWVPSAWAAPPRWRGPPRPKINFIFANASVVYCRRLGNYFRLFWYRLHQFWACFNPRCIIFSTSFIS